jgi:predicted nucleic acid-binding protein
VAFVLDASAAASLIFADEAEPTEMIAKFLAGEAALVPTLFEWEIDNLLVSALRRGRIDRAALVARLRLLAELPIAETAVRHRSDVIIELASAHSLSAYDAGYLELALTAAVPLATRDRRLADAARAHAVELVLP